MGLKRISGITAASVAVAVGAVLRPYWWAATTDRDYTFDHEPEVEFVVAFIQFFIAGIGFVLGSFPRRSTVAERCND